MSEEKDFHGYKDYEDWYDHGPGSVSWNRKMIKSENEYKAKLFNQKISDSIELERLREENKILKKENKCSGKKRR